jgi:two-component sensor histidine kinase
MPATAYPVPENEFERLAALRGFDILDTTPAASLERIVRLAARLFNAPMAFISLVDAHRTFSIAGHGSSVRETDRRHSICAHSMLEEEAMVICDATLDARFRDNPMVTGEMGIRFYVGASLRTSEGLALGSLCVVDTAPRERPRQDLLDDLTDLAFLIVEEFELRSATAAKRDKTELELRRSLQEKDTLLREVHHRVKNNLQIVSSLLKLQADTLADAGAASLLRESQQRVLSMALIHERLYTGKQMAAIEFDSYARTLVQELVYSYSGRGGNVTGRILPPRIFLSIGQAIPCGLILNELVTNALKHAYTADKTGEVMVELHESPEGRIRLAVSDYGKGLPPGFSTKNSKSLGLRIVDVLAKQLGGTLTYETGERTTFVLDFPREVARNRYRSLTLAARLGA